MLIDKFARNFEAPDYATPHKEGHMGTIQTEVKRFIVENFLFNSEGFDLTPDDSLIEQGIIDSTGILELVDFLETTYHIDVDDEELIPQNLDSLKQIAEYVQAKQNK